jgi:ribosomal protein S6--L-glutamate ligase
MEAATEQDLASIIIQRAEELAEGGQKVGLPEPGPLTRRKRAAKASTGEA